MASLIVPVFLQDGERPEDMFTSGSYRPLVQVLQGLRAHDEEAVELLAVPQEEQKRDVNPSQNIGDAPEDDEEESRLLLRFAAPRDPVMVAEWVSFNVIDTERQDWAKGYAAARRFRDRVSHLRVPYDHKEGPHPLGQWIAEQRRAYGAGTMDGRRAKRLDGLGMVWNAADSAFQENLAAARAYFEAHGTLAAPRSATALDRPVGQWLSNLRRPGALGDHPERAAALAEIDPDWNPIWPLEWQRHFAGLAQLRQARVPVDAIEPGTTIDGDDIGRWLAKQRQAVVWAKLSDAQREKLTDIGVQPLTEEVPARAAKASQGASGAFERGVAALRQYKARTGSVTVPRGHVEELAGTGDGSDAGALVKLGVWISNTKSRRAKLTADQLAQLAALGLDWA